MAQEHLYNKWFKSQPLKVINPTQFYSKLWIWSNMNNEADPTDGIEFV